MGTFDTNDSDDELLGSLFDDWDEVLSEGFGDILDASSSFGAVPDLAAMDAAVRAAAPAPETMPAVEGALNGVDVSVDSRPTPERGPALQLLGALTQPAFDASLSALGARPDGQVAGIPTLPRGSGSVVQDMSLSQLDAGWFEAEDATSSKPDEDSTRFGDMSEHVAKMATTEPVQERSLPGLAPATCLEPALSQTATDDPSQRTVVHGESEGLEDCRRDTADADRVHVSTEGQDGPHERPTAPEPTIGNARSTTDEEVQRFIEGSTLGDEVDVGNDSVTRFADDSLLAAHEVCWQGAASEDSATRLDDSILQHGNESDSNNLGSGAFGLSDASQLPSHASVLGDSAFADSATTRFGDSASIAAADHRGSGGVVAVSSLGAPTSLASSRVEGRQGGFNSPNASAFESAADFASLADADLPNSFGDSDFSVADLSLSALGVSQLGDPELDNSQGFDSRLAEAHDFESLVAFPDNSRALNDEPTVSHRDELSAAIAQACAQLRQSADPSERPDVSDEIGLMRARGWESTPASTPAPVAQRRLAPSAEERPQSPANGSASEDSWADALADDAFSNDSAPLRIDSAIPDELAVAETVEASHLPLASAAIGGQSTPRPVPAELARPLQAGSEAGFVGAQSTPAPVHSAGIVIVLDHTVGPSEVERRVQQAVEMAGQCTLRLGPRSVAIDRLPGPRGQWRAVEAAQDRAFAAGSVRSLIRRITSPRRGRDSVLDDLERRLARS